MLDHERDSDLELELEELKRQSEDGGGDDDDHFVDFERGQVVFHEDQTATSVLSWQEKKNIALIFSLYFVHAIPLTFTWASMPILLRQQLSYTLIGTFLVSQYPYSIKVFWSPIVQSKFIPVLGRRRTWIVPCFLLGGVVLFWLADHQDDLIARTAAGEYGQLIWLVVGWTALTFLCANLRIALDDWSLDLFTQGNVHWAPTTCTIAEMTAAFFSFNLFLGLSSLDHPDAGQSGEQVSTKFYFTATAWSFVAISVLVLLLQRDQSGINQLTGKLQPRISARNSWRIIFRVLKLPHVWILMAVHMTSMIGFMTNDAIAILQLVKNGFTDRDIAGLATVSFPFEILMGIYITKTFRKYHPLHVWRTLFPYRLIVALTTQAGVLLVHHYRTHHWRWFLALLPYIASRQFETMMFIALVSFHAQISDPAYGGIYLSLLATTLNIRYDTMGFIFTKTIGWIDGGEGLGVQGDVGNAGKTYRTIDGYQIVNLFSVLLALPIFWFFLKPATVYLQKTERREWRVGNGEGGGAGEDGSGVVGGDPVDKTIHEEAVPLHDNVEDEDDDVDDSIVDDLSASASAESRRRREQEHEEHEDVVEKRIRGV